MFRTRYPVGDNPVSRLKNLAKNEAFGKFNESHICCTVSEEDFSLDFA